MRSAISIGTPCLRICRATAETFEAAQRARYLQMKYRPTVFIRCSVIVFRDCLAVFLQPVVLGDHLEAGVAHEVAAALARVHVGARVREVEYDADRVALA